MNTERDKTTRRMQVDAAIYREWKSGKGWADIAMERGICTDEVRAALRRMGEDV